MVYLFIIFWFLVEFIDVNFGGNVYGGMFFIIV